MRVFLPGTFDALARLRDRAELTVPDGYAVTDALRRQVGEDADAEHLEYTAFQLAAEASLALLVADPAEPRRRVVISADVRAEPAGGDGRVRLAGPVPWAAVAAVHVDGSRAEPEVARAVAGAGPVEYELEWYDVSELDQLLA